MQNKDIQSLIEISRYFGGMTTHVIGGGGNTSYKTPETLWIKASGVNLATITENQFAALDRNKIHDISGKKFSPIAEVREKEVLFELQNCNVYPGLSTRPSVESFIHNLLEYKFVVHTHPVTLNSLLCTRDARKAVNKLFGDKVLFIPYADPGYVLFNKVKEAVIEHVAKWKEVPSVMMLENHGVFVSANNPEDIKKTYHELDKIIMDELEPGNPSLETDLEGKPAEILPAIRVMLAEDTVPVIVSSNSRLVKWYWENKVATDSLVCTPFIPDHSVYCGAGVLFVENDEPLTMIENTKEKIEAFERRKGYKPRTILLEGIGLIAQGETIPAAHIRLQTAIDMLLIGYQSALLGESKPLSTEELAFIENWEAENYRQKIALSVTSKGKLHGKIAIITGAAQGFGAGIAESLHQEGSNVVIADLNQEKGEELVNALNEKKKDNKAIFIKTDVSSPASVELLISQCIIQFGGLDVMISNAGILRAGGLDEMSPESFEFMTKVNYTGYFLCAKYASGVMKLQNQYKKDHFADIIQINSKSGLKGSNKNFAYAGGKFGGIGLTQSFALELMPNKIKVNSICPGNFFDGPLWSDPVNGLFVQYLNAGKVPGAKTIDDVKAFYEKQVPAGRGCTVEDVVKAILYVIDQEYETGQAVPVTGGQNMLN